MENVEIVTDHKNVSNIFGIFKIVLVYYKGK